MRIDAQAKHSDAVFARVQALLKERKRKVVRIANDGSMDEIRATALELISELTTKAKDSLAE